MNPLQRAVKFKELHFRPGIFVVPNPWDAGSAKFLEYLGFEALATTSAGLAYTLGKPDGMTRVSREQTLRNSATIIDATDLPVSADLESGFGDQPEDCAITINLAASIGLAGGSIEDATGRMQDPIYTFDQAVARVKAAATAARHLKQPFMLTARSENFLHGNPDLEDTIRRLVAFAEVGADVLYAPGIRRLEDMKRIVEAVAPRPVNILMGFPDMDITLKDLEAIGVKRVSVGSSLARVAYGGLQKAAMEILQTGSFAYAQETTPYATLNDILNSQAPSK